jgi:hypothetical protein
MKAAWQSAMLCRLSSLLHDARESGMAVNGLEILRHAVQVSNFVS